MSDSSSFLTTEKVLSVVITGGIPRLHQDPHWMFKAHVAATMSTCDRGPQLLLNSQRHGVGAVLVRNKRLIAEGYNGSPPSVAHCDDVGHTMVDGHCVATLHAERNALLQCSLDEKSPADATLYVTASPCFDCAKDLLRAKIKRVVYGGAYESRYGLSGDVGRYLELHGVDVEPLDIGSYIDIRHAEIEVEV